MEEQKDIRPQSRLDRPDDVKDNNTTRTVEGPPASDLPTPRTSADYTDINRSEPHDFGQQYTNAKNWVFNTLGKGGLAIIKHGRQGRPKSRRLQCDYGLTRVYCRSDSVYKEILISDIKSIRKGTDLDPISPVSPGFAAASSVVAKQGNDMAPKSPYRAVNSSDNLQKSNSKRKKTILDQGEVLYGTANLRRYCKPQDMPLCLSLITDARTFDIQFLNQKNCAEFLENMSILISVNETIFTPDTAAEQQRLEQPDGEGDTVRRDGPNTSSSSATSAGDRMPYDDELDEAVDMSFLLSQGFTKDQVLQMMDSIRSEALHRSNKVDRIDQGKSLLGNPSGESYTEGPETDDDDDRLSDEDQAAVDRLVKQGYTEEEALLMHLQHLHVEDQDSSHNIRINVKEDTGNAAESRDLAGATAIGGEEP